MSDLICPHCKKEIPASSQARFDTEGFIRQQQGIARLQEKVQKENTRWDYAPEKDHDEGPHNMWGGSAEADNGDALAEQVAGS